jgi:transposase InsO family protein
LGDAERDVSCKMLKYEEVWGAMYEKPMEHPFGIVAKERIERFRTFYNTERIHKTLGYKTPLKVIQEWKKLWEEQKKITYSYVA